MISPRRAAGAELNVAIGLARLGFSAGWVSRVGSDSFGRIISDVLDRKRVDRQRVIVDPAFPTGFQLNPRGIGNQDPLVEYFRRGSAASHLSIADFDPEYFLSAWHLHVTGIAPALSKTSLELAHHAIDQMRAAGKSISFDPNLRPVLWSSKQTMIDRLNALAARCDWILPGIEEGRVLTGRSDPSGIADFYLGRGATLVVIKLGEKGSFIKNREKEALIPAAKVPAVVDTVGAGDAIKASSINIWFCIALSVSHPCDYSRRQRFMINFH